MKKTSMKRLSSILVFVLLVTVLTGCGSKNKANTESTVSTTPSSTTSSNTTTEETKDPTKLHEVYSLATSTIYFDGLRPSYYESRADIKKALPLKIKGDVPYIGMPISRMSSEVFVAYAETAKERCEEYGYKFEFTDANGSTEKQRADFDAFVTKGVDVILINPLDPITNELDVTRAVEKGVAVVGFGIAFFPSAGVITCVGSDNYNAGFALGQEAAKALEGESVKLGLVIGRYGQSMMESKANGFLAGLIYDRFNQMGKPFASKEDGMLYAYNVYTKFRNDGKYNLTEADIDIVASGEGQLTANIAMKVTEDIFTAHPDINLFYVDNDVQGEGVVMALDTLGVDYGINKQVKLCFCGGANEFSMNLLRDEKLLATVHNNPAQIGHGLVDVVHAILEEGLDGNNLTISTFTPVVILTKDNVDEYQIEGEYYPKALDFGPISIDEWNEQHK